MPILTMPIRLLIVAIALLYLAVMPYKAHAFTATTPTGFNSATKAQWIALGEAIVNTRDRNITLYTQGRGGLNAAGGDQFIEALLEARHQGKTVTMVVTGRAGSMSAIILCYASKVVKKSNGTLMFHATYYNMLGVHVQASDHDIEYYMRECVNRGLMTEDDMRKVKDGYNVNITPTGNRYYTK